MAVNWQAIEAEYVTTDISLRDLADKWSVAFATIGRKSGRANWAEKRETHDNKVITKAVQKAGIREVVINSDYIEDMKQAARMVSSTYLSVAARIQVEQNLKDMDTFARAMSAQLANNALLFGTEEARTITLKLSPELKDLAK